MFSSEKRSNKLKIFEFRILLDLKNYSDFEIFRIRKKLKKQKTEARQKPLEASQNRAEYGGACVASRKQHRTPTMSNRINGPNSKPARLNFIVVEDSFREI
jgi:hypothetical protein